MRLAAVLAAACLAAPCLAAAAAEAAGTITVSGTGEVFAAPDRATVSVGVTTEAAEAAAAMRENSGAMAAVMARLTGLGIAERDLQTSSLSLSPRWEAPGPTESAPRVTGFVATNMLTVVVRDLEALGGVLDAALGDGANTLGGLVFGIEDDAALRDAARREAVADAAAKARVLAEAAGVTLGPLQQIAEGGDFGGPFPSARMDMAVAGAPPVAPGELGLTVTVTMTWAIAE
jgi:uncharacterized protein YggE